MLVAHGIATDFEGEDFTVADDVVEGDALCSFNGFNGLAGGDASQKGKAIGAFFTGAGGQHVDGPAAIVGALEQPFVLQIGDVFVHGGERAKAETTGDLLIRGGVAVLLREAGEKVEDLFLSPRDSHAEIVANKKRIAIPLLIPHFFRGY